jgi:predicted metal-dependent hydrolase
MKQAIEIIQGKGFEAVVVRTARRKTATVKVDAGKVSVVVPSDVTAKKIEAILKQKHRWIQEKLLLQKAHQPSKPKEYVSGEAFAYLGRNYRLKVAGGSKAPVKLKSGRLVVTVPKSLQNKDQYIKDSLTRWYREHALTKLEDKVQRYSKVLKVVPESVAIRTFKGRWGSCSSSGSLVFNWKIIIAPTRIVDYVVIHELCHLIHHNHGPKFWKSLERACPDFRACKEWLRVHGRMLDV